MGKCNNNCAKIKHVMGNTLSLAIPLQDKVWRIIDGEKTAQISDFVPLDTDTVSVNIRNDNKIFTLPATVVENVVSVVDNGTISKGCYGVEIMVQRASGDVRRYYNSCEIHVVEQTREAGIEDGVEFEVETHNLEAAVFEMMRGYSAYEIWLQQGHTGTEADFLEWLTGAAQIDEKIAQVYADLENYYTKLQTYNREEIDNMVSAIPKFKIQVVAQLPTTNISVSTIYLVHGAYSEAGNLYTEYIYTGVRWEVLGKQNFDLSQYVTIQQLNNMLASYYTSSAIDALLQGYVVKVTGMGLSQNDFTNILKAKLESLENYDDTQVRTQITALTNRLDTLVDGDVTQAIDTFNEIIAFLDGLDDTQSLAQIISSIQSEIAGKADAATTYTKTEADTKFATNETVNGAAFLGGDSGSSTTADFDPQTDTVWNIPQSLGSSAKAQARANIGAQEQLVSGTNVKTVNGESILGQGNITIQGSGEANVIESISVNNTPVAPDANKNVNITVPAAVTESTVAGWGFTKNTGTYSKPSSGIPASDLAQGVIPDISDKEDKILLTPASGTALTAEAGHYYRFDNAVGTLTVTLPTPTTLANVILFFSTSTTPNVTISHNSILYHEDYEIAAESTYEVNCLWNGTAWIVASIKIGGAS